MEVQVETDTGLCPKFKNTMDNLINIGNSGWVPKWVRSPGFKNLAEKILHVPQINELIQLSPKTNHLPTLVNYILESMDVRLSYNKTDLSLIPTKGPLIVVSNHPFGGIEGIALASLLFQIRPDVKILTNYLLKYIIPLSDLFIGVNPFETKKLLAMNINGLKEAKKWLADGGMLGVFPAGTVSHWQIRKWEITDPGWNKTIARLAEVTQASIQPAYFHGRNSWYFQLAGIISPHLRTGLLPQQFFAKKNSVLNVAIGKLITFDTLNKKTTAREQIEYLRQRTYILKHRLDITSQENQKSKLHPIAQAIPSALQIADLDQLPASACLLEHENLVIYIANAKDIPHLLLEIGRLREITFRLAEEGTGKASDLDEFDQYYLHLFAWDRKEKKIVGAYRLGLTDQVFHKGMYISTLFKLSQQFFAKINPGIELGRSFIIPEYQKKPLPLFLLWKAILKFAVKNPRYISIYGAVSISAAYQKLSRDLLIYFLHRHYWNDSLAPLIQSKKPYPFPRRLPKLLQKILDCSNNFNDLDAVLREIEPDRKGVPILLKQYKNIMNTKAVGFNQDSLFNYVVDCLCLVYIPDIPHKKLNFYMGKKDLESYLKFHGL